MVGQCLVLVLRGEPAPLRNYLVVTSRCLCRCDGVRRLLLPPRPRPRPWPPPLLLQLQRCSSGSVAPVYGVDEARGGDGETWFYGRACSIARPHRNREKPARRRGSARSGSDGARDGTRGEASEKPSSGLGRDRTERERQGWSAAAKKGERGRKRKCVFGHVTLPLLRLAEAECVNHRPAGRLFLSSALHN